MHSCWLDVGMQDHVRPLSSPSLSLANKDGIDTKPWTLLWKSAYCDHLHNQLGSIVPEAPLVAHHYQSYLLRDIGTYYAKAKPSRALNPGHLEASLGLGDIIDTSGTLWIPSGHFNWQRGHIALEVLINLYISRNPLQAKLARQSNVQALTTNQVTIKLQFQQLTSKARIEYGQGHSEDAERLADRAITLAVQEIAQAYHQHFLAKLHSYWDRTQGQFRRQRLPVLDLLKQAQEDSAAETGRIPTAQTIHGVYAEAWAEYCKVMTEDVNKDDHSDINISSSSSSQSALPEELPY
ncbi:hypothetical protein FOXYSP1_08385 [Fusarium oxysporum f. sp. phaseoli]